MLWSYVNLFLTELEAISEMNVNMTFSLVSKAIEIIENYIWSAVLYSSLRRIKI